MYYTSDQLDITKDDLTLDDMEGDEQSDWLNHTDSNLSYEEVSLSNEDENDTCTTTTEGTHNYAELVEIHQLKIGTLL